MAYSQTRWRDTTVLEKLLPSLFNATLTLVLSTPLLLFTGFGLAWKITSIAIFYFLQILDTHENTQFRCLGMRIFGTCWEKRATRFQRNAYSFLYTASFASLFFSIFIPFDLFFLNIFLLQLPALYFTGTTFHGFVSGNMRTKMNNPAAELAGYRAPSYSMQSNNVGIS